MLAPQKKCSSISKHVELSTGWQSWLTSLGSQKVLLMLNFWNKKLSRKLLTWMNLNCMVARLRLRRRGLMFLGWSSVHHVGIIPTMATLIDHTEHRTSPHMVMGGLPDSAALCATDPTSEVRGSEVQCKTSHGHCSVPGIIKPAAVSFALFDNWHVAGLRLNAPVSVAFSDLCINY